MKHLRHFAWIGLGVLIGLLVVAVRPPVHALPEYVTRTGQPCSACHVNPAGGGPRTVRGLLWVAQGRPDEMPPLPGAAEEPAETTADGQALYEKFGCSACHGPQGEGGVGPALNQAEWAADEVARIIRDGLGSMMAYKASVMSDAELEAIVQYVRTLGHDEAQARPMLEKRPLPPPYVACGTEPPGTAPRATGCGGN
jgi:cytochrome c551/c552